jgi:hypothetical protein
MRVGVVIVWPSRPQQVADANSLAATYFLLIDLTAQTFSESIQKCPETVVPQRQSRPRLS